MFTINYSPHIEKTNLYNVIISYYGVNDPVAEKLMRRAAAMPALPPPEDKTISTLYIGNLSDGIQEETLRSHFYQFGEIR